MEKLLSVPSVSSVQTGIFLKINQAFSSYQVLSVKKIVMYIIYKNMIIFFLLEVNIAELNWLDWIDEAVLSWHDFHIFHTLDQFRSLLADSEKIEEINNIYLRMIRIFITNTGCPIWNPNFFVKMISQKIRRFHIEYPQNVKNYFKIVQLRKFLIQNLKINKYI